MQYRQKFAFEWRYFAKFLMRSTVIKIRIVIGGLLAPLVGHRIQYLHFAPEGLYSRVRQFF